MYAWRQQKYFFFFFLYCAWLQSESLAHIFKAKELKSKPETKSEADKALILQIESVQKDFETTFFNLHAVIKHNRPIYESCIMLISIRPGIWWCFKKGVLRCKIYIRSVMFSFGLANFLSLSDRMSDMLKKFSTSLLIIDTSERLFFLLQIWILRYKSKWQMKFIHNGNFLQ